MKKCFGAGAAILTAACLFVSASAASSPENHVHNRDYVKTYAAEMENIEKSRQKDLDNLDSLVMEGTTPAKNAEEAVARAEKQASKTQLKASRKEYVDAVKELKKLRYDALIGNELNESSLPQPVALPCTSCGAAVTLHERVYVTSITCGEALTSDDLMLDDAFIYYYDCTACPQLAEYPYLLCAH